MTTYTAPKAIAGIPRDPASQTPEQARRLAGWREVLLAMNRLRNVVRRLDRSPR